MHDLSDEDLCARWVENPYYQLFCGEEFFRHKLTFDRSSLTRWRQRMGEGKLVALIQESLAVATRTGAAKPADFSKVIVDHHREAEGGRLSDRRPPNSKLPPSPPSSTGRRQVSILCILKREHRRRSFV
jgi:hypothetical protein